MVGHFYFHKLCIMQFEEISILLLITDGSYGSASNQRSHKCVKVYMCLLFLLNFNQLISRTNVSKTT